MDIDWNASAARGSVGPIINPMDGVVKRDFAAPYKKKVPDPYGLRDSLMMDDDIDFSLPPNRKHETPARGNFTSVFSPSTQVKPASNENPAQVRAAANEEGSDLGGAAPRDGVEVVFKMAISRKLGRPSNADFLEKQDKLRIRAGNKIRRLAWANVQRNVRIWRHEIHQWNDRRKAAKAAHQIELARKQISEAQARIWDIELKAISRPKPK